MRQQAASIYPVLAVNLMAVTSALFRTYGIDLNLSVWLEGKSGSGKTSIAQTFGKNTDPTLVDYRYNDGAWHLRTVIATTEKTAHVLKELTQYLSRFPSQKILDVYNQSFL